MTAWVYCQSHVGPHETGWCSVSDDRQIPLRATSRDGAMAEVKANGWPIYGYCRDCYAWIANDHSRPYARRCESCDQV